jgi:hypothetical protein
MIDNIEQVDRLLLKLLASLPLQAAPTPELAALMRKEAPEHDVPRQCDIVEVSYAGDEGGIMCRLLLTGPGEEKVFYVSITHLAFHRRHPLARAIAVYQKHRIKRMRVADADRPSEGKRTLMVGKVA